jgi:hypothetical protein
MIFILTFIFILNNIFLSSIYSSEILSKEPLTNELIFKFNAIDQLFKEKKNKEADSNFLENTLIKNLEELSNKYSNNENEKIEDPEEYIKNLNSQKELIENELLDLKKEIKINKVKNILSQSINNINLEILSSYIAEIESLINTLNETINEQNEIISKIKEIETL